MGTAYGRAAISRIPSACVLAVTESSLDARLLLVAALWWVPVVVARESGMVFGVFGSVFRFV